MAYLWVKYKDNSKYRRGSHDRCSIKIRVLKNSQNSQEKTYVGVSFLIKFMKKEFQHRCFPVNFEKISRTPFHRSPPLK